jgi:hypothetical protein
MAQEAANQLSNSYWLDIMEQSQAKPFYLDYARTRQHIALNLTKEDVNTLAAKYFSPNSAVRFEAIPVEKSSESLPSARRLRGLDHE